MQNFKQLTRDWFLRQLNPPLLYTKKNINFIKMGKKSLKYLYLPIPLGHEALGIAYISILYKVLIFIVWFYLIDRYI